VGVLSEQPWLAPPAPVGLVPRTQAPTMSVCIAAYQAAATIGATIESVLGQTTAAHDIVVCDDGSTDDLKSALARYGDSVRYVRQGHQGVAAARNQALRAATGEYAVLLDADDTWAPERLHALGMLACARPDLAVVTTDAYIYDDGVLGGRACHDYVQFAVDDQLINLLRSNYVFGSAAFPRERVLGMGGLDESLGLFEDWDLWLRLVLDGGAVGMIDLPLASYWRAPGNLTSDRSRYLRSRLLVLERVVHDARLTPRERQMAADMVQRERLKVMRHAIQAKAPDLRLRAWAVARQPRMGFRRRGRAAFAAAFPGTAARLYRPPPAPDSGA
jgi:glycosyltransferase involved in cell wall biosynthesis